MHFLPAALTWSIPMCRASKYWTIKICFLRVFTVFLCVILSIFTTVSTNQVQIFSWSAQLTTPFWQTNSCSNPPERMCLSFVLECLPFLAHSKPENISSVSVPTGGRTVKTPSQTFKNNSSPSLNGFSDYLSVKNHRKYFYSVHLSLWQSWQLFSFSLACISYGK